MLSVQKHSFLKEKHPITSLLVGWLVIDPRSWKMYPKDLPFSLQQDEGSTTPSPGPSSYSARQLPAPFRALQSFPVSVGRVRQEVSGYNWGQDTVFKTGR